MSIPTDEHQKRVRELEQLLAKREASDDAHAPARTEPLGYFANPPPMWNRPPVLYPL
jgi:hypothetical protein